MSRQGSSTGCRFVGFLRGKGHQSGGSDRLDTWKRQWSVALMALLGLVSAGQVVLGQTADPGPQSGRLTLCRIEVIRTYRPEGVAALAQEPGRKTYAPEQRSFELGWDFRWPETKANANRSMATVTLSEVPTVIELGAAIHLKAAMRAEWKTSGYGVERDHTVRLGGMAGGAEWSKVENPAGEYQAAIETDNPFVPPPAQDGRTVVSITASIRFGGDHTGDMEISLIYWNQASASGPSAGAAGPGVPTRTVEWVIYATEVGWLRIGTRAEFDAKWKIRDEINGGDSERTLGKALLMHGLRSHDDALRKVCDNLTGVKLHIAPSTGGGPVRYLTGILGGKELSLHLAPGFDAEMTETMSRTGAFYKALEYDFDAEWAILRRHGITPRYVFGRKQWFVHSLGHGSLAGPVAEDRWTCVSTQPETDSKGGRFVILADGLGGTVTHGLREAEGPFLDNYTLARVMRRNGVREVDLWPPVSSAVGRDVQPRVKAEEIPENPRDYGENAQPTQVLKPNPLLRDWVAYVVENRWLHVGTRFEFSRPLPRSSVLWSAQGEEPATKTLLFPQEGDGKRPASRRQALRAIVSQLTDIAYSYEPGNQPREVITAMLGGQKYYLRLERGPDPDSTEEYRSGAYDGGGNLTALREVNPNIVPRKRFQQQWLVHATGHGTYSGPVKDDLWMMIASRPNEATRSFVIPDGMGGTFGYGYDKMAGPFSDSYQLAAALRELSREDSRVARIGLYAEDRGVGADDVPKGVTPIDSGQVGTGPAMALRKVSPAVAGPGEELAVTILAANLEPGTNLSFGDAVRVGDPVYLGRDADSELEQWQATVTLDRDAPLGSRALTARRSDGATASLAGAFEVRDDTLPQLIRRYMKGTQVAATDAEVIESFISNYAEATWQKIRAAAENNPTEVARCLTRFIYDPEVGKDRYVYALMRARGEVVYKCLAKILAADDKLMRYYRAKQREAAKEAGERQFALQMIAAYVDFGCNVLGLPGPSSVLTFAGLFESLQKPTPPSQSQLPPEVTAAGDATKLWGDLTSTHPFPDSVISLVWSLVNIGIAKTYPREQGIPDLPLDLRTRLALTATEGEWLDLMDKEREKLIPDTWWWMVVWQRLNAIDETKQNSTFANITLRRAREKAEENLRNLLKQALSLRYYGGWAIPE